MMHFVALLIKLRLQQSGPRLTVTDSSYAHAAIMRAISQVDVEAGRRLHEMRRHKCIAVAITDSGRQAAVLRLTFLAEEGLPYANMLINALSASPELLLGRKTCTVEGIDLADPGWCGISTWADFTTTDNFGGRIFFYFVTPTAITKGRQNGRFFSLYPEPDDVFLGLARRWQALQGPELPPDLNRFIREGGCVVSRYELRTVEFRTTKCTQIGFIGNVVYECRSREPEYVATLNALARLARFTGIGYHTTQGMGAVQVAIKA